MKRLPAILLAAAATFAVVGYVRAEDPEPIAPTVASCADIEAVLAGQPVEDYTQHDIVLLDQYCGLHPVLPETPVVVEPVPSATPRPVPTLPPTDTDS